MKKTILAFALAALLLTFCQSCTKQRTFSDDATLQMRMNDSVVVETCHHGVLAFPDPGAMPIHMKMHIDFTLRPPALIHTELSDHPCQGNY